MGFQNVHYYYIIYLYTTSYYLCARVTMAKKTYLILIYFERYYDYRSGLYESDMPPIVYNISIDDYYNIYVSRYLGGLV